MIPDQEHGQTCKNKSDAHHLEKLSGTLFPTDNNRNCNAVNRESLKDDTG